MSHFMNAIRKLDSRKIRFEATGIEAVEMKGIVVYDTYYGNTKIVADAIVEQVKAEGHEAELHSVREINSSPSQGEFLVVGSPIRMGKVTKRARKFVEGLNGEIWKDRSIMTFVTMLPPPGPEASEKQKESYEKWDIRAAQQLRNLARAQGLRVADAVLMVYVKGLKGPLVEDGVEKTKQFVHNFIATLKK